MKLEVKIIKLLKGIFLIGLLYVVRLFGTFFFFYMFLSLFFPVEYDGQMFVVLSSKE